ncbi:terminase family protein [Amycolatopsis cynarae]|uniref:Terminase family protein n=1 Tax=Amycolatopsis cynarae TaxID=2995223 RepID=A0ABY7B5B2_9PSEU|nr:terminase family protein [Amycolatopsis sp. HUAS 11-8]WAL67130.1 terminase family protein [Amycolatopsis sp. HUAS 11-8]
MAPALSREDIIRARDDFGLFCRLLGQPRTPWQLDTMELTARQTLIVSPRQCGKSQTLSLKATHFAFRQPKQMVLLVSAGETAATRLLRLVRDICQDPLLAGSVVDDTMTRVVLANGSEIHSVPASERSIRGNSVDLLIVDECAFVPEDILMSAALPTTAARPKAKIILASSPWGDAGPFFQLAMQGLDHANPHIKTFRWKLADAHWIAPEVVEAARAAMSPLRFRAEYEGEFITSGDAYFSQEDLLACVADFPLRRTGERMPAACGLDWGRRQDAHAVALAGLLDDFGVNGMPVVILPWVETSRRRYGQQVAEVESLSKSWSLSVRTETNGVGAFPSEELGRRLGGLVRVKHASSTQVSKEDAYGRVQILLAERQLVLPNHMELLKQLGGITASPTASGGLKIGARVESLHDDLPDAMSLAVAGLPRELARPVRREPPDDLEWAETTAGIRIPLPVRTITAELDWGEVYQGGEGPDLLSDETYNPWLEVYR